MFAPMVALLEEALEEVVATGLIHNGIRSGAVAGLLIQAVIFGSFALALEGKPGKRSGDELGESIWDLVFSRYRSDGWFHRSSQ